VVYKLVGKGDLKRYKGIAKKVHEIYSERVIGQNSRTEYLISTLKLKNLIADVNILKMHYKKINELTKSQFN
jgi:hypothetical protein